MQTQQSRCDMAMRVAAARRFAKPAAKKRRSKEESEADELLFNQRNAPQRSGQSQRRRQRRPDENEADFFARSASFQAVGAYEELADALRALGYKAPSHIQALAYGPLLNASDRCALLCAQAGSGKTLAYLAPLVQQLKLRERSSTRSSSSPSLLIVVPTEELAQQVLSTCRSLAKAGVKFRSVAITGTSDYDTGETRMKTQIQFLKEENLDVVIATPGRLLSFAGMGLVELSQVASVVFDEADLLASRERGFHDQLVELAGELSSRTQVVLATATMPKEQLPSVERMFPNLRIISGPNVHKSGQNIKHSVIDCSLESSEGDGAPEGTLRASAAASSPNEDNDSACELKLARLERELRREGGQTRTVIFCNSLATCRRVENRLRKGDRKEKVRRVRAVHSGLRREQREANIALLCSAGDDDTDLRSLIIVTTDRASRGLDVYVDQVVLFDLPDSPSEFIRRAGRAARGTRKPARVTCLAVGEELAIARQVMEASNAQGSPLMQTPT